MCVCVCKCNLKGVPLANAYDRIQPLTIQTNYTWILATNAQWKWMRKPCKICAQILYVWGDIFFTHFPFRLLCVFVYFFYDYWNSFWLVVKNGRKKWNFAVAIVYIVSLCSSRMYPIYFFKKKKRNCRYTHWIFISKLFRCYAMLIL